MPLIFTRYLYIKDEVEISLASSILGKKDEAIFWAYELYYSGYETETFDLLWKIYYYFFASLNPCFETYFLKKHKEWLSRKGGELDYYVSAIVNNLIIRPFNIDVFLIHKINTHLEFEENEKEEPHLATLLENSKYVEIAKYILDEGNDVNQMLEQFIDHFVPEKKTKLLKEWSKIVEFRGPKNARLTLISRAMMFYSNAKKLIKGRSFYVIVEPEETVVYETIESTNSSKSYNPYKVLSMAYMYPIDKYNYLSLFDISRNGVKDPLATYHLKWLYHASSAPVWLKRIHKFNGTINHDLKQVTFDDSKEELFYNDYGYEPDEQRIETQHKSIQPIIQEKTWDSFYANHKQSGLFQNEDDIVAALELVRLFE
jgi:hypothetical protein